MIVPRLRGSIKINFTHPRCRGTSVSRQGVAHGTVTIARIFGPNGVRGGTGRGGASPGRGCQNSGNYSILAGLNDRGVTRGVRDVPHAQLMAIEFHLPEKILANDELADIYSGWTPDAIEQKLGVRTRRVAAPDETASDLGLSGGREAVSPRRGSAGKHRTS